MKQQKKTRAPKSIAARPGVSAARIAKGYTQSSLAIASGLSEDVIQRIEAGKPVGPDKIAKYGQWVGLSWEEMIGTGRPPSSPKRVPENEVGNWFIFKPGPYGPPTANGLQWSVHELHHKVVPNRKARGKVYDLKQQLNRHALDEIKHLLTRHAEVSDRVKFLSTHVGKNLECFHDESHPNQWWVIDEWIDGASMEEVLREGPMERARALHVMLEVAEVLQILHEEELIYRNLAPRSIHLTSRGVVVTDFELAKILEGAKTVSPTQQWPQWDRYVAPEIRNRQGVQPSVDLYSWAMILAHAISGELPGGPVPAGQMIAKSGLPPSVVDFARQCLGEKKTRPDSFGKMLTLRKKHLSELEKLSA